MKKERPTFRDELEHLEAIVRALEERDIDLDEALKLFEEGVARLKSARSLLQDAEVEVKRVIEQADGTIKTAKLDT
ncbi:MAG: exodeoxyribonuclease VII small subunit [Gemmatimonadota bacterium]|nr:exodeoxyribonuclease VII small subunit [Gemmatimonadota bacterium]MDH3369384.1 exodeoxyribonuclease VII small subunit [Gemmatimonadota bacterium]MDH3478705.1 exodeoxyribonuclease VII small subunit [Gemmatimonadota bacterium]MDH5548609.1 exodeoxyribonuclease VII small subunit [Gemmatimonadota bacterium]